MTTAPTPDTEMFSVDSPHELARWRPLFNWVLAIPQLIIANAVNSLAGVIAVIYWFILLFTGKLHQGMYNVIAMATRYELRAVSYLLGFSEEYPPFDFTMTASDNRAYPPIRVELPESPPEAPRTAALNILLAIPHYIVFIFYMIAAVVVAIIAWFAVLFTGRWPEGMRHFLVRVNNYWLRIWVYVVMVRNDYPKFGLQ